MGNDPTLHGLAVRLAVVEERIRQSAIALELQAKEYERRLGLLNQTYERLEQVLQLGIQIPALEQQIKINTERLSVIEGSGRGTMRLVGWLFAAASAIVGLIGVMIAWTHTR